MSRTEQLRLLFSSLLDTFMLLLLFVYTWNGVAILVLQNFERISALKPSVETEKNAWLDCPLVSFRIWSREDDIKDTTWDRFTGMRWWEGGRGSRRTFFFPWRCSSYNNPPVFFSFHWTQYDVDFISNTTGHRWPRQKWHWEAAVGPSLILNKW